MSENRLFFIIFGSITGLFTTNVDLNQQKAISKRTLLNCVYFGCGRQVCDNGPLGKHLFIS